jgi:hypothetical protein
MPHIGNHDEVGHLFELDVLHTFNRKIIPTLPLKIVCLILEVQKIYKILKCSIAVRRWQPSEPITFGLSVSGSCAPC